MDNLTQAQEWQRIASMDTLQWIMSGKDVCQKLQKSFQVAIGLSLILL